MAKKYKSNISFKNTNKGIKKKTIKYNNGGRAQIPMETIEPRTHSGDIMSNTGFTVIDDMAGPVKGVNTGNEQYGESSKGGNSQAAIGAASGALNGLSNSLGNEVYESKGAAGKTWSGARDTVAGAIPIAGLFHGIGEAGTKIGKKLNAGKENSGQWDAATQSFFSPSQGMMDHFDNGEIGEGIGSMLLGGTPDMIKAFAGVESQADKDRKKAEYQGIQNKNKQVGNDYLASIGESTRIMANGGSIDNEPSELTKFFGPSHDQGGIDIGGGKEVEGGETMKDGFISSNRIGYDKNGNPTYDEKATKITFADKNKKIEKLFIGRNDPISKRTKDRMYAKVEADNKKVGPIADAMNGNPSEEGKFYFGADGQWVDDETPTKQAQGLFNFVQDQPTQRIPEEGKFYFGSDGKWYPDQQPLNLQTGNPMPTERIPEQKQYMPTSNTRQLAYLSKNYDNVSQDDVKGEQSLIPRNSSIFKDGDQPGDPEFKYISKNPNFKTKGLDFTPQASFNTKDQNTTLFGNNKINTTDNNNPTASNNNSNTKTKIGFSTGDYLNMSSSVPSIAYNFGQGLKKAEVEDLQLNPEADKVKQLMAERKINFQPLNNEIVRERTKGSQDIGDNIRGVGARNANLQALYNNSTEAKAKMKLAEQQANIVYRGEEAGVLNNLGQQEAAEKIRRQNIQSMNDATKQNFIGAGFAEMGEGLKNTGNAFNTKSMNNLTVDAVNSLSTKYGISKEKINSAMNSGMFDSEEELVYWLKNKKNIV